MIGWEISNSFLYVPLNVNCLSTQGPACPLGYLLVSETTATSMLELCEEQGGPLVFDFFGINISDPRAFSVFDGASFNRPVLLTNVNEVCLNRIRDDGAPLELEQSLSDDHTRAAWVGSARHEGLPTEVRMLEGRFTRAYLSSRADVLTDLNDILPSTPVHATKYYDVKKLCITENGLQIVATGLAIMVLRKRIDYDYVVASSHTGALVAAPVSVLLAKPLHCWTELGPAFRPKRRTHWIEGRGKKCLLVADVICMGSEARAAQAFVTASGGQLVGCAAVASYLPSPGLPCLSLLNRGDLERMGYQLSVPKWEGDNGSA
jgi:orotate phosphoribosyltransferase